MSVPIVFLFSYLYFLNPFLLCYYGGVGKGVKIGVSVGVDVGIGVRIGVGVGVGV